MMRKATDTTTDLLLSRRQMLLWAPAVLAAVALVGCKNISAGADKPEPAIERGGAVLAGCKNISVGADAPEPAIERGGDEDSGGGDGGGGAD